MREESVIKMSESAKMSLYLKCQKELFKLEESAKKEVEFSPKWKFIKKEINDVKWKLRQLEKE